MVLTPAAVRERMLASARMTPTRGGIKLGFNALGTTCEITFAAAKAVADRFAASAIDWVAAFESKYSRFLDDSLITRINLAAGRDWVSVDEETERLFRWCHEAYFVTSRAFDPTSMPLVRLWNWKAENPVVPTPEAVERARRLVGWSKVQRKPGMIFLPEEGMCLDLGGIGKEYAVDCVLELAGVHGIRSALVNFGQDIRVSEPPAGLPAWHVGLEDPKKPGACWTGVAARRVAVASSGDYLRSFTVGGRRYGHILDPRTGYPVNNQVLGVTVIAPTCTLAGMLSTSAFILGPQAGLSVIATHPGVEGCIHTDNHRYDTKRFSEHLTR